jgi:hypothetical protein
MMHLLLFHVVFATAFFSQGSHGDPALDKLAGDLTRSYVAFVKPGNISVTIEYGLASVDYREDRESVLTTQLWERYEWKDSRLSWDPAEYNGISSIAIPANLLWTPDIVLYNSFFRPAGRENVNADIFSDGRVRWVPRDWHHTRCLPSSDDRETLSCTLKFGSWTYNGWELKLKVKKDSLDLRVYTEHPQYSVLGSSVTANTVTYPGLAEPYTTVIVTMELKKRYSA